MSHTNLPRNCTVFLLLFEHTQSAIYASQKMDSHKWLTVLVDEVKVNLAILGHVCVDHCILLLKHLSTHNAFYIKRLQMLFKDQLGRSKAACSFQLLSTPLLTHDHLCTTGKYCLAKTGAANIK